MSRFRKICVALLLMVAFAFAFATNALWATREPSLEEIRSACEGAYDQQEQIDQCIRNLIIHYYK